MSYILDTHVIIWFLEGAKLPKKVINLIGNEQIYISAASIWEIGIKIKINKLTLDTSLQEVLNWMEKQAECKLLDIDLQHIYKATSLPLHHQDPFDRLLISQAQYENLTLITKDQKIADYEVQTLW